MKLVSGVFTASKGISGRCTFSLVSACYPLSSFIALPCMASLSLRQAIFLQGAPYKASCLTKQSHCAKLRGQPPVRVGAYCGADSWMYDIIQYWWMAGLEPWTRPCPRHSQVIGTFNYHACCYNILYVQATRASPYLFCSAVQTMPVGIFLDLYHNIFVHILHWENNWNTLREISTRNCDASVLFVIMKYQRLLILVVDIYTV